MFSRGDVVIILGKPAGVSHGEEYVGQIGTVVRVDDDTDALVSAPRLGKKQMDTWWYSTRSIVHYTPIDHADDEKISEFIDDF